MVGWREQGRVGEEEKKGVESTREGEERVETVKKQGEWVGAEAEVGCLR